MNVEQHIKPIMERHRKTLRRTLLRITIYYVVLATLVAILITMYPGVVEKLPLGGVGDIAGYNTSDLLELEEALLSADGDELEELATETARARMERMGPST